MKKLTKFMYKRIWERVFGWYPMKCIQCQRKFYCKRNVWSKEYSLEPCYLRKECYCPDCVFIVRERCGGRFLGEKEICV